MKRKQFENATSVYTDFYPIVNYCTDQYYDETTGLIINRFFNSINQNNKFEQSAMTFLEHMTIKKMDATNCFMILTPEQEKYLGIEPETSLEEND